jgi:hypothetical protein
MEEFKKQFLYLGYELKHGSFIRCESTSEKVHDDYCSATALAINSIGIDYFDTNRTGRKRDTKTTYVGGKHIPTSQRQRVTPKKKKMIMPRSYRSR